ncbi:MAG: O-antigen ligase family protein [Bacillota bacterium]|nr:O-antigen ligase family protein [Bacillota bacterium]
MQKIFMILFVLTMNITKVVDVMEKAKFNIAFSDVLMPVMGIMLLIGLRKYTFKTVFKHYPIYLALVLWIVGVGYLAMQNTGLVDAGWMGIFEELVKTLIVIAYFWVGYHTLKILSIKQWQWSWVLSALLFVFGGFVIYIYAKNGTFLLGEEGKYLSYYMGTDTDPNHAASFLTLTFFGMGALALINKSKYTKTLLYCTMAISLVGLFLTGSRGGMIGMAIGLAFLVFSMFFINWRVSTAIVLTVIILFSASIFIDATWFESVFAQRILNKIVNIEAGFDIRFNLGKVAWLMGVDHPIFGVGRGNYPLNALPYFEMLEAPFIDNIPHNTYFGLFAEVGIIGTLLFFTPLFAIFYATWKRFRIDPKWFMSHKALFIWILSGIFALGVQASVLNVENRRFLWYLAGVLIYFIETYKGEDVLHESTQSKKWLGWINLVLMILVLMVSTYTFKNAFVKAPRITMEASTVLELPKVESEPGDELEFRYHLILPQNEAKTERLMVSIYEVGDEGNKVMLDNFRYIGASGPIIRTFTPKYSGSEFHVAFYVLDETLLKYYVTPKAFVIDEKLKPMDDWYYLQPPFTKDFTADWYWTQVSEHDVPTDLTQSVDTVFGERLKVIGVDTDTSEEGYPIVSLKIEVLKDFTEDFVFWAHGYPDNIHLMPENRLPSGLEGYGLIEPIITSEWKTGEVKTLSYKIPHDEGTFKLFCGFYINRDGEVERLLLEDGKTHSLELGFLNTDDYK